MKLNVNIFILLLFVLFLFTNCETSQKLIEHGQYKKAIEKASIRLESSKVHLKERAVLNEGILKYFDKIDQEIDVYRGQNQHTKSTESLLKFEISKRTDALDLYSRYKRHFYISNLNKINAFIDKFDLAHENLFKNYIQEARIFQNLYQQTNSKFDARNSFENYKKALDLNLKLEFPHQEMINMLFLATERIFIDLDCMENTLKETIQYSMKKNNGYSEYHFKNTENIDCHVQLRSHYFYIENSKKHYSNNYCKKVEDGYSCTIDSSGNEILTTEYKTIEATVFKTQEIRDVIWKLSINIEDISGQCTKASNEFIIEKRYIKESIDYTGDPEALPYHYNATPWFRNLPNKEQIKVQLTRNISEYLQKHY